MLYDAGRPSEAIDILKAIESEQPGFAPTHSYLATIYLAGGDDPGAIAEMAEAARLTGSPGASRAAVAAASGFRL